MAYRYWNDALDNLTGVKNSLIKWRLEFTSKESRDIDTDKLLQKCGIWGCLLGGVLTSKMAMFVKILYQVLLKTQFYVIFSFKVLFIK